jgi:hypothetical protein
VRGRGCEVLKCHHLKSTELRAVVVSDESNADNVYYAVVAVLQVVRPPLRCRRSGLSNFSKRFGRPRPAPPTYRDGSEIGLYYSSSAGMMDLEMGFPDIPRAPRVSIENQDAAMILHSTILAIQ